MGVREAGKRPPATRPNARPWRTPRRAHWELRVGEGSREAQHAIKRGAPRVARPSCLPCARALLHDTVILKLLDAAPPAAIPNLPALRRARRRERLPGVSLVARLKEDTPGVSQTQLRSLQAGLTQMLVLLYTLAPAVQPGT